MRKYTLRHIPRYFLWTIMLMTAFSGCAYLPGGKTASEPSSPPPSPHATAPFYPEAPAGLSTTPEPVTMPITLHEAMARTVKSQIRQRTAQLEKFLRQDHPEAKRYDVLIDLAESAGYPTRSDLYELAQLSSAYGDEQARMVEARDLDRVWRVLDLGVLYASTRGNPNVAAEAAATTAMANLIQTVRQAYFRSAAAQEILPDIQKSLERARDILERMKDAGQGRYEQQRILDLVRMLHDLNQRLAPANTELALLMNLRPGTRFDIAPVDWQAVEPAPIRKPVKGLEYLALAYRPEVKNLGGASDPRVFTAGRTLMNFFPDATEATGAVGGPKDWWNAGSQIALNLFHIADAPLMIPEPDRRATLDMGVIAQLHISRLRYDMALDAYNETLSRSGAGDILTGADQTGADAIQAAADRIWNELHRYLAFAALQNAAARMYHSVGIAPLPSHYASMSVSELSRTLARSFAGWPDNLESAFAAYGTGRSPVAVAAPPAPPRPIPSEEPLPTSPEPPNPLISTTEPARPEATPEPVERESMTASDAYAYQPPRRTTGEPRSTTDRRPEVTPKPDEREEPRSGSVVINAAQAEEEGRKVVREVSVYRDVVNIHFQPSYRSRIKGQGLIGERYEVLGWSPEGWIKIKMGDGSAGWIPTKYIKAVDEFDKRPERRVARVGADKPETIVTRVRANVRSGPGLGRKVMYTAEEGMTYAVRGRSGEWYKIRARNGRFGWLHESVVVPKVE